MRRMSKANMRRNTLSSIDAQLLNAPYRINAGMANRQSDFFQQTKYRPVCGCIHPRRKTDAAKAITLMAFLCMFAGALMMLGMPLPLNRQAR